LAIFLVLLLVLLVKMPYKLYAEQRATIHSLNQRLTPKIRLSFHHDAEGLAKTPIQIRQEMFGSSQIKTSEFTATYVRIRVEAMSETAVTGCKAFLTKLEREDAGGKTVSDIALPHGVGLKESQPFDVHPSVICAIDFLVCSSENDKLVVPERNWPLSLRSIFDDTGTYHFTIKVNGGGISDSITVAVGWPGQWDKITAREVKHKDRSHYASI
jgi:hypothetical protein